MARHARFSLLYLVARMAFCALYGTALATVDGSRRFTAAAWQEILDNFYPRSEGMRITERETVPSWDVNLQADDVTKMLNSFQTFCWFKHGMDDHLPFFWSCDIRDVTVEVGPPLGGMNCSHDFLEHIRHGDDPRCVPWGATSVADLGLDVDPMFDEYEFHEGSQMFDPVQQALSELSDRLGLMEAKLQVTDVTTTAPDSCPQIARGCEGRPSSLPDGFPCSCFQGEELFSTCRNHHWGLVQLCRPEHFSVSFVIFHRIPNISGTEGQVEWFQVRMSFQALRDQGHLGGLYRCHLWLREERMSNRPRSGGQYLSESILAIVTLTLILWFILQSLGLCLLFLPRNLRALMRLREDPGMVSLPLFKERFTLCLMGTACRQRYVNHFDAIMEIIVSCFMLAGLVRSIYSGGDPCEIEHCHHGLEVIYVLFLDDDACHATAWLLLYVTIMFACLSLVDKIRWVPRMILLCAVRLLFFIFAYGLLLCGYGIAMYIAFGPSFVQFSTPLRSCAELLMLTVGMPMDVFNDLHPFADRDSTAVTAMLALYGLFMSIIGLNFFTTIILDAYNQARDLRASDAQLDLMGDEMCRKAMEIMGLEPAMVSQELTDSSDMEVASERS